MLFGLIALILGAIGCTNLVITTEPLFHEESEGAPVLKPGVWHLIQAVDPDSVGEPLVLRLADGRASFVRQRGAADGLPEDPQPNGALPDLRFLVVVGEPILVQLTNQVQIEGRPRNAGVSGFVGLLPLEWDGEGRIVAASAWILQCGLPPEKGDQNYGIFGEKGSRTNKPYAGLKMTGETCEPANPGDLESLRNAARLAMQVADDRITIRWVGP